MRHNRPCLVLRLPAPQSFGALHPALPCTARRQPGKGLARSTHDGLVEEGKALHGRHGSLGVLRLLKHHPRLAAQAVRLAGHHVQDVAKLAEDAAHALLQVCGLRACGVAGGPGVAGGGAPAGTVPLPLGAKQDTM